MVLIMHDMHTIHAPLNPSSTNQKAKKKEIEVTNK